METTILYLFIYIIEAFILWWYASKLFSSNFSKLVESINIFMGYGCLFLISFIKSPLFNSIAFTLVNFIIIIILYNAKWNLCLFHSLIITCIMSFSEIAIGGLFSKFNETSLYINPDMFAFILMTLLSKVIYFISLRFITTLFHGNISEHHYTNKTTVLLNIIPFISIYIIITLTAILLTTHIPIHFRYMLSSCAILLLLINILIFYIYHYTLQKNKEFTELQIQLQKEYDMTEYYKSLFSQNENQQILIHDIRKHLMAISLLNEQNEPDKINHYLDALLNSSSLQNSVHVSDNELLNSILCHYMQVCQKKQIELKTDVRKKLLSNLDYSDLTALFCNLLDNAVEACSNIDNSYIDVSITAKEHADITVINVINTCRIRPDFNKSGRPITAKKNKLKHGFGLKSVERIVNKYHGNIKMYFDEDRMTFHTIIILKNKSFE